MTNGRKQVAYNLRPPKDCCIYFSFPYIEALANKQVEKSLESAKVAEEQQVVT